jgi:hypothetical protein
MALDLRMRCVQSLIFILVNTFLSYFPAATKAYNFVDYFIWASVRKTYSPNLLKKRQKNLLNL